MKTVHYLTYSQEQPRAPVIACPKEPNFVEKSVQEDSSSCHQAFIYTQIGVNILVFGKSSYSWLVIGP